MDSFIAECHHWYRANGWLHVPHFLSSATASALLGEAQALLADPTSRFDSTEIHSVFQEESDPVQ